MYLFKWRVIEGVWTDVGEANEKPSSTIHIWVFLDCPHRVQQVTFVICDKNIKCKMWSLVKHFAHFHLYTTPLSLKVTGLY